MSLRFFADHCIPNSIIKELENAGHDALRLRDYIPIESSDINVFATAQKLDAILLSLNGDFFLIIHLNSIRESLRFR